MKIPNHKSPRLIHVMWWSVRLSWSHNKATRRRLREAICSGLGERWRASVPESPPGMEVAIVHAIWLGSALASRSVARYPLLPTRLKRRLVWTKRLLGKTTGKSVIAAYLAWVWLREAALSAFKDPGSGWNRTTS